MGKKKVSMLLRVDGLTDAYAEALESLLATMQALGRDGSSRWVALYSDGDGAFRPQVSVSLDGAEFRPARVCPLLAKGDLWERDEFRLDPDQVAIARRAQCEVGSRTVQPWVLSDGTTGSANSVSDPARAPVPVLNLERFLPPHRDAAEKMFVGCCGSCTSIDLGGPTTVGLGCHGVCPSHGRVFLSTPACENYNKAAKLDRKITEGNTTFC